MVTDKYVFFWKGKLSNFYKIDISYNGKWFHSSEQLFMWLKAKFFNDEYHAKLILESNSPQEAKNYGRKVRNFDSEKWDAVKCDFMYKALQAKFYGDSDLRSYLMRKAHKGKFFVEASPYDKIWGIGMSENDKDLFQTELWGENLLGKLLNKLYDEIQGKNQMLKSE